MATNKTWLRHQQQVEAHGDAKTRDWEANGEPSPAFYVNKKGGVAGDGGDARGRYGAASLAGGKDATSLNRNLSKNQF